MKRAPFRWWTRCFFWILALIAATGQWGGHGWNRQGFGVFLTILVWAFTGFIVGRTDKIQDRIDEMLDDIRRERRS